MKSDYKKGKHDQHTDETFGRKVEVEKWLVVKILVLLMGGGVGGVKECTADKCF